MTIIASANRGLVLGVLLLLSCLYEGLVSAALQAQPLLQQADLAYQGAFRLPTGTVAGSTLEYGGTALAFNPANNSLFVNGHIWGHMVAEINIPQPVNSTNVAALPYATVIQAVQRATEGRQQGDMGGLLVHGGKLIITDYIAYDAAAVQVNSHYSRPLNLTATGQLVGPLQMHVPGNTALRAGFFSGYMTPIPQAWQAQLGGPAITGNCCLSIISRTSHGPAAFAFDPATIGSVGPIPASPLVYYDAAHTTLGPWNATSKIFNGTTEIKGVVFPDGTNSVLFFGRQGIGTYCYGQGTMCNDPVFPNTQGNHGAPYIYQVWAYDAAELAAVKAGSKQPWQVVPYATWTLTLPFSQPHGHLGGAAYDPATQRVFVSQRESNGPNPLIHVFKVNAGVTQTPLPPAPQFPPPALPPPPPPQNVALKVNAGLDQTVTFPGSVTLNGLVTYNGLTDSTLIVNWSKVSGPGTVIFANSNSAKTTATFSVAGSYVLRLSANDGAATTASDDVSILIKPAPTPASTDPVSTDIDIDIESNKRIRVNRCETDRCVEEIRVRRNTNIKINGVRR